MIGAKDAITAVKDRGIKLADQAYVLNNGDGNLEFKEGKDAGGGKGFVYGASTVAVAGLLLGPVGWGAVAKEGYQDQVREILFNQGGEVVSVGVTDDLKGALEGAAPEGVTVAEDGSSAE